MEIQNEVLTQIDAVLAKYREIVGSAKYDDLSDQPKQVVSLARALLSDCIKRFAPSGSQHVESMQRILDSYGPDRGSAVHLLAGVVDALRFSYQNGYLGVVSELIRADIFADFLETAEYLLSEGYKDPAAVMAGSVLEEHLRSLASKNGIGIEVGGKPKKADQLNGELASAGIYTKLDLKLVTAWLDLRNKAAHGKYHEYSTDQVTLHVQGIRDFIVRVPA